MYQESARGLEEASVQAFRRRWEEVKNGRGEGVE